MYVTQMNRRNCGTFYAATDRFQEVGNRNRVIRPDGKLRLRGCYLPIPRTVCEIGEFCCGAAVAVAMITITRMMIELWESGYDCKRLAELAWRSRIEFGHGRRSPCTFNCT